MSKNTECLGCGKDLIDMTGPGAMIEMIQYTRATSGMVCACCSHIQLITTNCPGREGTVVLAEMSPKVLGKLEPEVIEHLTSLAMKVALNKAFIKSRAAC